MKKRLLHILVIACIGVLAYANTFHVPFSFDDKFQIVSNPLVRGVGTFISSEKSGFYGYNDRRYVGYLSFALNYQIAGLDAAGYHAVNLAIHIINAILVYFLVILIFRTPYFDGPEIRSEQKVVSSEQTKGGREQSVVSSKEAIGGNERDNGSSVSLHYSLLTTDYSQFIALFSALLFVAHPLQTQAVTYVVQRLTSLAALFYLLSLVFYIKGRLKAIGNGQEAIGPNSALGSGRGPLPIAARLGPIAYFVISLLSAVCAMKTKEIAFTLPVMIVLCEFVFFGGGGAKKKLLFLAPVLLTLLIIPMSVLHTGRPLGELLSDLSEKSRLQTDMPRGDYLMTEMRVIVTYLRLLLLPMNQNIDYDYPVERSFFTPSVFLSFLFLSSLLGLAGYLLYKTRSTKGTEHREANKSEKLVVSSEQEEAGTTCKEDKGLSVSDHFSLFTSHYSRLIAFGILWFFLALSVESSVIPIVDVIFEHRVYLPSAGACIAMAAALNAAAEAMGKRWLRARRAAIIFAGLIIVLLSTATFARNAVWGDEMLMWEDVVKKSPGSARAHNNLGFLYQEKAMNDEAISQFIAALDLKPDYIDARINLGVAYHEKGMNDQAISQFLTALREKPDDADAHNNLGIAYVSAGLVDEGIREYQTALKLRPGYAEAYNGLGVAYGSRDMLDPAVQYFRQAVALQPDYAEARYNLALAYLRKNDIGGADAEYDYLARISPDMAQRLLPLIQETVNREK